MCSQAKVLDDSCRVHLICMKVNGKVSATITSIITFDKIWGRVQEI